MVSCGASRPYRLWLIQREQQHTWMVSTGSTTFITCQGESRNGETINARMEDVGLGALGERITVVPDHMAVMYPSYARVRARARRCGKAQNGRAAVPAGMDVTRVTTTSCYKRDVGFLSLQYLSTSHISAAAMCVAGRVGRHCSSALSSRARGP